MEVNGERNRGLYVLKSRGMAHSNQLREFILTSRGVQLVDVYLGASGVLTGSARTAQKQREQEEELLRQQEVARRKVLLQSKRQAVEGQISALRAQYVAEQKEMERLLSLEDLRQARMVKERQVMAVSRKAAKR